jgi:SAM-dependent methyltransferase
MGSRQLGARASTRSHLAIIVLMMQALRNFVKRTGLGRFINSRREIRRKHFYELEYWSARFEAEGPLKAPHLQQFYTTVFGLKVEDYAGKRILDIGCGPRGSLEWADSAKERVGLDPLANEYKKFGANRHKMRYVAASSEQIPFPDSYFDAVTAFNSLDHVDDLPQTIREIKRVSTKDCRLLIITEIGHPPTPTEPQTLSPDILREFEPEFVLLRSWTVKMTEANHDIYQAVLDGIPAGDYRPAVLCADLAAVAGSSAMSRSHAAR